MNLQVSVILWDFLKTTINPMLRQQRSKFSLPERNTYLNCAYMSPLMKSVEKAGIKGMMQKRNPANVSQQDFFTTGELIRKEFSKLIKTKKPTGSPLSLQHLMGWPMLHIM